MQRSMFKSKIHRARVTGVELDYEGSIAIDSELLERADILPGELVHVLNITTGERFITYAIKAEAGSRVIMLNGAAARLAVPNDLVIILTYCQLDEDEARVHCPTVVLVDENNNPVEK